MALSLFEDKPKKKKVSSSTKKTPKQTKEKKAKPKTKKIAKKATKAKKEKVVTYGPQSREFYGHKINRFLVDSVWFYDLVDFLGVGAIGDHKAFLNDLKDEKEYDNIFKDGIRKMEITDKNTEEVNIYECIDTNTAIRLVKASGKPFPGPTVTWLIQASKEEYVEQPEAKTKTVQTVSGNPPTTG